MDERILTLAQLDRAARRFTIDGRKPAPARGWIRTLREALGMTTAQLGRRLGVSQQSIVGFEKREPGGEITLKQLRRIGDALECDVLYAMVPRNSLRKRVDNRAEELAKQDVASVSHSMMLEAQKTDSARAADLVEQRKREILAQRWSRLWS